MGWGGQVIMHFQTTLPLLREADVAQVFFYWSIGLGHQSFQIPFGSEKNYFMGVSSFQCCFWERGGGVG